MKLGRIFWSIFIRNRISDRIIPSFTNKKLSIRLQFTMEDLK